MRAATAFRVRAIRHAQRTRQTARVPRRRRLQATGWSGHLVHCLHNSAEATSRRPVNTWFRPDETIGPETRRRIATFEVDAPDWERWDATHLPEPRLVARSSDKLLGWAALSPVTGRCVYAGVAEVSHYVWGAQRRQGVGSLLLAVLIDASENAGIWTLQGGIFPENVASLALVRKHGFREVGRRERLGKMTYGSLSGAWRDVILVERRSRVVSA